MQDNSSQEDIQPANFLTLPNPIDIYLGRRIALIRAKACLSRQAFADKLRISEPLLNRFERGAEKYRPRCYGTLQFFRTRHRHLFCDILPEKIIVSSNFPKRNQLFWKKNEKREKSPCFYRKRFFG